MDAGITGGGVEPREGELRERGNLAAQDGLNLSSGCVVRGVRWLGARWDDLFRGGWVGARMRCATPRCNRHVLFTLMLVYK